MERDSWDLNFEKIKQTKVNLYRENSFTIRCNNCGREIELKDCFKDGKWEGIDIFDLALGGILITCECGNEIKSERLD